MRRELWSGTLECKWLGNAHQTAHTDAERDILKRLEVVYREFVPSETRSWNSTAGDCCTRQLW